VCNVCSVVRLLLACSGGTCTAWHTMCVCMFSDRVLLLDYNVAGNVVAIQYNTTHVRDCMAWAVWCYGSGRQEQQQQQQQQSCWSKRILYGRKVPLH
jgi:hypothetical protein